MRIGAPFNPYKIFQGVFAPYWILEHRAISAGAKLCYVRLMGFAGRDARCYPSLETLGNALGVSERQTRDYVKELERAKLIAIEQRGLRRTNIYLFLWTEELARMTESIPDTPEDPTEPSCEAPPASAPDRNNRSALDRNSISAPDRNKASGQERNRCSGPIGINSERISSNESSSSSRPQAVEKRSKSTKGIKNPVPADCPHASPGINRTGQTILAWSETRSVLRLRSGREVGPPDREQLRQWAGILERAGLDQPAQILAVMDDARVAADRSGEWRNWGFLTLQVQLAAERAARRSQSEEEVAEPPEPPKEDHEDLNCDWARAKALIRAHIPEIAYKNWFAATRQIRRRGHQITVAVSDEPTRLFLEAEYADAARRALAELDISEIVWMTTA
jgi:hypothetical protein